VKELSKSVHICQSYRKNRSGPYFMAHDVYNNYMWTILLDGIEISMTVKCKWG